MNCKIINENENIIYKNIFDDKNPDMQIRALKQYMKIWEKRKSILENDEENQLF